MAWPNLACDPALAAEPDGPAALIGRAEVLTIAVQSRLSDRVANGADAKSDTKALLDFYADPKQGLLWVDASGLTSRAKAVIEEIGKADDYGLRASDYRLPKSSGFDKESAEAVDWLVDAEIKIDLAVLRYARDARGGRIDPQRLSPNLDPTRALPDPVQVMESIAIRADPAVYLRSFQPDQPQFEALRKALIAARGGKVDDNVVRIPDGPVLKLGVEDEQVALLRKRLQLAAADGDATVFDDSVADAVKRFQQSEGVFPDGMVGPGTRRLLNGRHQSGASPARTRLILINMERWRWLPNDLGSYYVTVNIPEFLLRVMDDGKPTFVTRVVVGKPDTQTPIFSNEMRTIVFGPYWNVPNSIKTNELLPSIRPGGGDWLFGGGGGGYDASVFERNGLRINIGGREVDPSRLDWSRIDIRALNIYQPPGPDNVLGNVKFLFPNKHDVYMHDTTQKTLFARSIRAESHGCMRVQNPDQFAALLLKRDQNWSSGQVASAFNNSSDRQVPLKESIPVYINYFTLWVNDDGSISTFSDLYGHDSRMAAALFGETMAFEEAPIEAAAFPVSSEPRRYPVRRGGRGASNSIADSISNFINN